MTAFKTTAVLEDACHLRLDQPLADAVGKVLNVIVMVEETPVASAVAAGPNFQAALGSCYREHPTETRRGSDQWLAELREGEVD